VPRYLTDGEPSARGRTAQGARGTMMPPSDGLSRFRPRADASSCCSSAALASSSSGLGLGVRSGQRAERVGPRLSGVNWHRDRSARGRNLPRAARARRRRARAGGLNSEFDPGVWREPEPDVSRQSTVPVPSPGRTPLYVRLRGGSVSEFRHAPPVQSAVRTGWSRRRSSYPPARRSRPGPRTQLRVPSGQPSGRPPSFVCGAAWAGGRRLA